MCDVEKTLREQLAAGQAREKVMREALETCNDRYFRENGFDVYRKEFDIEAVAVALSLPTDDTALREYVKGIEDERDALKRLLESCRSSVKFDLLHYEKMSSAYKNLGAEGKEKHELAEAEANRLHRLMDDIDAAMQKGGE